MRKIGIEIENESLAVPYSRALTELRGTQCWEIERDGSLRGGAYGWEIKTAGSGLLFDRASASLNELYPVLVSSSGVWRAAIHVHVDVSDLVRRQQGIALGLCYALDDSLFEATSPERRESNFCVPLVSKTNSVFNTVGSLLRSEWYGGYGKYSSINVDNITSFGTFEFRHMRTPQTNDSISSVNTAINSIRSFAKKAHDIINVVSMASVPESRTQAINTLTDLLSNTSLWRTVDLSVHPEQAVGLLEYLTSSSSVTGYNDILPIAAMVHEHTIEPPEPPEFRRRPVRPRQVAVPPTTDASGNVVTYEDLLNSVRNREEQ